MNTLFRRFLPSFALLAALSASMAQAQPIITLPPLSLTNLLLGNAATFTAGAVAGAGTNLTFQWLKNGVPIPGETNTSLTMNNVQGTNCGAFSVRVSDGQAVAVSPAADLTVNILQLLGKNLLLDVVDLSGIVRSSTVGAGKAAGEPEIIGGDPGGNLVWFKWTPLLGGIVTFSTAGSDFDTIMGVYTGTAPANLVQVPSAINDDDGAGYLGSQVTFNAQALKTYVIGVDGYYGVSGNVVLSWTEDISLDTLPAVKVTLPSVMTVSNGASVSLPSPWSKACNWYFNGQLAASSISALAITNFSEANVGAYVAQISTADGHTATSQAVHLQMNVLQDGTTDTNSYAWNKFADAVNFGFTSPPVQGQVRKMGGGDSGGYSVSQTFSTIGDTEEPGEPNICGQVGGHPGWYTYVTPARGSLLITTTGSLFNTQLGVYTGPGNSFATLTNIGCGYTTNYILDGQPVLSIQNVPANQTNYIVVDGENGASGTVHLRVTMGSPVTILTPPQSQAVAAGSNVTFNVGATGGTPLAYFWEFNGAVIPGATSGTLTINNAQASSAGTYTVFVTNAVSTASSAAVLSLVVPPAITNQPSSQVVGLSSNVTFVCAAAGSAPMLYQWKFADLLIAQTTNTSLLLTNVQITNAGSYLCVVTNMAGVVTSSVVTLSVQTSPEIITQPASQTFAAGAAAVLNVVVSGFPAPSYQWYFNGAITGANSGQLTIPSFQTANQGTYSVTVSNALGVVTSAPSLVMLNGPGLIYSYGVTNGAFQLQLAGTAGSNYVIQSSCDLVHWTPLLTNSTLNGFVTFLDTNISASRCFYRTVTQ